MPFSSRVGKLETLKWFQDNEPSITRILDIGVGSGTYAKLLKNNNVCVNTEIIGIEAWKPYIEQFALDSLYTKIINQDVRAIAWKDLGNFDVAIAGDVLEHVTKEEAIDIVEQVLDFSKTLIISIPVVHMPQDAYEGNPFEIHVKPDWSHEEVLATWPNYIKNSYRKSRKAPVAVYWLSR
jgi:SAM-dependent methyltransferase